MKTLHDIMNGALKAAFIQEVVPEADDLVILDNQVLATKEEVTECYYGNMLIQPVIVKEFSTQEVQEWVNNQYVNDMIERYIEGWQ